VECECDKLGKCPTIALGVNGAEPADSATTLLINCGILAPYFLSSYIVALIIPSENRIDAIVVTSSAQAIGVYCHCLKSRPYVAN
jgi:hypothetical protein